VISGYQVLLPIHRLEKPAHVFFIIRCAPVPDKYDVISLSDTLIVSLDHHFVHFLDRRKRTASDQHILVTEMMIG
jgi:hypothetical protein